MTSTPAHPRMRGEHSAMTSSSRATSGSSPHARGTPSRTPHSRTGRRLIPACAGNTAFSASRRASFSAHPRMRGEHALGIPAGNAEHGSSPHARGTRPGTRAVPRATAAHPRMRGEHAPGLWVVAVVGGSSPHARGTHGDGRLQRECGRLIPACAGNTWRRRTREPWRTAHPRMRGEHTTGMFRSRARFGSSPHARGTPEVTGLEYGEKRLIPACAGNTDLHSTAASCRAAHPRMRGEHGGGGARQGGGDRLIPACAGNTSGNQPGRLPRPAHPRMRGEHGGSGSGSASASGSSPHARGTHVHVADRADVARLIPACAGNTSAGSGRRCGATAHPRMRGEHN